MFRPTIATRMRTLLVALLFVGGNFGLATVDGLLNHLGRPGATATASHIESDRGCGVHAERCVLENLVAQHQHAALPGADTQPTRVADVWREPMPAVVLAPASVALRSNQPRAPPANLAL
jgi:hypothetical protein